VFPVVCPRSTYCPANADSPTLCPSATPYAFMGSSFASACSAFPVVTTLAGGNGGTFSGSGDGLGTLATFRNPRSVVVGATGTAYVADTNNHLIRAIHISTGVVYTLAGGNGSTAPGSANGQGTQAMFNEPFCVAVDTSGTAYVADYGNNVIRAINISTGVVRTLAGGGGGTFSGKEDGQGTFAMFRNPSGVAVDASGTAYVADFNNHLIRAINISTGVVRTLAGGNGSTTPGSANGQGTWATFKNPWGVAVDALGAAYFADFDNHLIRAVNISTSEVRTLAGGNGGRVFGSADGQGTWATFHNPVGVAVDASGTIYVADQTNNLIRVINTSTGAVRTLAGGDGGTTFGSADGQGTSVTFYLPQGVAIDGSGTVYVADFYNNIIRAINSAKGVCGAGTYFNPSSSTCVACVASTFCPPGTYLALPCPLGFFCPVAATALPQLCPAGAFCNATALVNATACPSGTFNPLVGQTSVSACTPCGAGTYGTATGQTSQATACIVR
jgi:streptogramin lyase